MAHPLPIKKHYLDDKEAQSILPHSKKRRRGAYKCSKCGKIKKGHYVCSVKVDVVDGVSEVRSDCNEELDFKRKSLEKNIIDLFSKRENMVNDLNRTKNIFHDYVKNRNMNACDMKIVKKDIKKEYESHKHVDDHEKNIDDNLYQFHSYSKSYIDAHQPDFSLDPLDTSDIIILNNNNNKPNSPIKYNITTSKSNVQYKPPIVSNNKAQPLSYTLEIGNNYNFEYQHTPNVYQQNYIISNAYFVDGFHTAIDPNLLQQDHIYYGENYYDRENYDPAMKSLQGNYSYDQNYT